MLRLDIADSSADEIAEQPLPVVPPRIERKSPDCRGSQAVQTNGGKHACPLGIEALQAGVAKTVLPLQPAELGGRTREPVEDDAVAGNDFFEEPVQKDVAPLDRLQSNEGRDVHYSRPIGFAAGGRLER